MATDNKFHGEKRKHQTDHKTSISVDGREFRFETYFAEYKKLIEHIDLTSDNVSNYKFIKKFEKEVWRGERIIDSFPCVIKRIAHDLNTMSHSFERELWAYTTLGKHELIVDFLSAFKDDKYYYIIVEYIDNPDMFDFFFASRQEIPIHIIQNYVKKLVDVLDYCHSKGVIHGDVKPENVVVTKDGSIKLIDFGYALKNDTFMTQREFGTLEYLSPEMVTTSLCTSGVDIWALGVIIYQLITLESPFNYQDRSVITRSCIRRIKYARIDDFLPEAVDLIKKIFVKLIDGRISIEEIKVHPFLTTNYN